MPRSKDELRGEWEWMIINDITLEDRKKEMYSKNRINDFNDQIEVIMKTENREQAEELFKELENFEKENPDVIQDIVAHKEELKAQREKEIEDELRQEHPELFPNPEKEAREREEERRRQEAEDERFRQIKEAAEKAYQDALLMQQGIFYTGLEAEKREQVKQMTEVKSLVNDIFDDAYDEYIAEDAQKNRFERRQFIRDLNDNKAANEAIHDLGMIKKNYRKDIDFNTVSAEDLAEAEQFYDSIMGGIPGDKEINFGLFKFYPMTGYTSLSVNEYVDKYIEQQSEGKSPEEIEALESKRDAFRKATFLHAMAESTFMLKLDDEEYPINIETPELNGPHLQYYIDYWHNGDKPPVYEEKKPEAGEDVQAGAENPEVVNNVQADVEGPKAGDNKEAGNESVKEAGNEAVNEAAKETKTEETTIQDEQITNQRNAMTKMWQNFKTYQLVKNNLAQKLGLLDMNLEMQKYDNTAYPDEYKTLAKTVKNALNVATDSNKTPDDVKKALKACVAASNSFKSASTFGIYEIPQETKDIIKQISEGLPSDYYLLGVAERNLESEYLNSKGINEKNLEAIYKEYAEAMDVNLNNVDVSEATLFNKEGCMMGVARYQKELMRDLNKQYKTNINLANYNKPNTLVQLKDKPSTYDLAGKYIVTKNVMDMLSMDATDPNTLAKTDALHKQIKNSNIKQQIKDLSNNKVFQEVAKKHPDQVFTTWKAVEDKANALMEQKENYFNFFNENKLTRHDVEYELKTRRGAINQETGIDFVSTYLTNELIADPKNIKIRQAIVTGMLSEEGIKNDIANKLIKNGSLEKKNGVDFIDTIKNALNGNKIRKDIISSVIKNAKPKAPQQTKKQTKTQTKDKKNEINGPKK